MAKEDNSTSTSKTLKRKVITTCKHCGKSADSSSLASSTASSRVCVPLPKRRKSLSEGFLHTHSRLEPHGERIWSNVRSHSRHDAYVDGYEPSSFEGETSSPIAHLSVQMKRWTEMVGEEKKGHVFGLTGMTSQRFPRALTYTPSEREQQLEAELKAMNSLMEAQKSLIKVQRSHIESQKSQIEFQESQMEAQTSTVDAMKAQLDILTQFMMSMQQQPPPSSTFPRPTADIPYPTTVARPPYPHPSRQLFQGTSSCARPPVNLPLSSPRDVDNDSDETE